ncbi:uncharacterized protein PHALS_04929 [Plasmopara halstedii]|uniref:Uncharacterized protein n=1 Tax=Plasmopara halstedii TaxID=4781 RepID=A0A0P1AAE3_PLAHL|nr:uncharacterized protein PHALS_04929 [Plasmopara halstedii]CEG37329.1 hypothetical protein PHALS_04929 [Plasmopara halstedii]|eukprot:XP_024573698.1 hypothetical protein PHALS_04929 [Plasmopara halstedii]
MRLCEGMNAPCLHLIAAIKFSNQLSRAELHLGDAWSTKTYRLVYDEALEVEPFVTKSGLVKSENLPPNPFGRKGRPKKKRIESQHVTLEVDAPKSIFRCGSCSQVEHIKRRCTSNR